MSKSGLLIIISVAVLSLLGLVYLAATWESPQGTTTVVIAPPVEPQPQQQASSASSPSSPNSSVLPQIRIQPQAEPPAPAAEPVIEELPVEVTVQQEQPRQEQSGDDQAETPPAVQLPSLNASDAFVFNELRGIAGGAAVVSLLARDQIVRKFVVFVENISRDAFPQTGLPYRALGQEMPVNNIDENLFVMDEMAHSRFDQVVNAFIALDVDASMALYRLLSPLFQQAYAEIGFRDSSFDETLARAINNVLRKSEVEGPFQLVKPSVMYLYADASIENLDEVHKQLIRIGPENSEKLKSRLREFQQRL